MNKKVSILMVVMSLVVIIILVLIRNPIFLLSASEGFNEPSKPFYFMVERIYKLSEDESTIHEIDTYISNTKNSNLNEIYLRITGVVGAEDSSQVIKKHYEDSLNAYRSIYANYIIVSSMGLTGDSYFIPILETLLENTGNENQISVSKTCVASSLYLITGDSSYNFINESGFKQKLNLSPELINARKAIVNSYGRKRTFGEMVIIDKIYRPSM